MKLRDGLELLAQVTVAVLGTATFATCLVLGAMGCRLLEHLGEQPEPESKPDTWKEPQVYSVPWKLQQVDDTTGYGLGNN